MTAHALAEIRRTGPARAVYRCQCGDEGHGTTWRKADDPRLERDLRYRVLDNHRQHAHRQGEAVTLEGAPPLLAWTRGLAR